MAWNEPGGGKDPWGGNRSNEGPPDIDEAIKKLKETFSAFGGGVQVPALAAAAKACCP